MDILILKATSRAAHAFSLFPPFNINNWTTSEGRALWTGSKKHREQRDILIKIGGSDRKWTRIQLLEKKDKWWQGTTAHQAPTHLSTGAGNKFLLPKGNTLCFQLLQWSQSHTKPGAGCTLCWASCEELKKQLVKQHMVLMVPALTLGWEQRDGAAGGHQCLSCTSLCHRLTADPWGCLISGIWQQWAEFLLPANPATANSLLTLQLWVQRHLFACRAFDTAMPSALCTLKIHTHFCTADTTYRSTGAWPYLTGPLIPAPSFWVQLMLYSSKMEVSYSRRSRGRGKSKQKKNKQNKHQNYYSPSQTPSSAADLQIAECRRSLFCSSASPRQIKPKSKRSQNIAQQKAISVLLRLLPPAFWSRIIENSKWDLAALTQAVYKGYFSLPSP